MRKLLPIAIISLIIIGGCTSKADLLEMVKNAKEGAQECVDNGGHPFFWQGTGYSGELSATMCIRENE